VKREARAMSTIRFHLRGSRALINGSLAVQNDG
jgi:hypothetical protein